MTLTDEQINDIIQQRIDGVKICEIAKQYGLNYQIISRAIQPYTGNIERAKVEKAIALRKQGMEIKEIAVKLHISDASLKTMCARYGVTLRNHDYGCFADKPQAVKPKTSWAQIHKLVRANISAAKEYRKTLNWYEQAQYQALAR